MVVENVLNLPPVSTLKMTFRLVVVFLAITGTLVTGNGQRSDEKTNQAAIAGSMTSMAQSLGLPSSAAMASLSQNLPAMPSFLVQTVDRVSPAPAQCVTDAGQEGVCMFAKQCLKIGGVSLGRCSDGETICCHRPEQDTTVNCGAVVTDNEVVFQGPDYPHQEAVYGQCQVTVHAGEGVCQLRLDFTEFSLSPPETCGPRAGYCLNDAFSVSAGLDSSSYPVLCGFNSGQHMYVDVSQTRQAILSVRLNARLEIERRWTIRIAQVSCWSPLLAPEGCLQYHTKAADVITSFNFARNPTGFHYYANLHYSICIRRQLGFCSILYEENGSNAFRLSPLVNQRCRDAYVLIPTGSTGSVIEGNLGDRICGTTFTPVAANISPFRVSFVTGPRIGYTDCPCPQNPGKGQSRPNFPPQVIPTQQTPRPVEPSRPTTTTSTARPRVPETPIGSQQPGGLASPPANQTQGRQFADALVCRAGGFSLRYTQLPHGC
ncbi:hypothetical protein HPB50_010115 [Hyalomma asiaticum]|uniref:Uncharacterized protein n=1 Tax=Hyalomma asiaticum TaxID=266040 RepID=A0ACB7RTY7_HYAAI|nr:hypothetical protein HPB50_010115 [Hyalomma asiaticum]